MEAQHKLGRTQAEQFEVQVRQVEFAQSFANLEKDYEQRSCPEHSNSQMAQVRQHTEVWKLRLERWDKAVEQAEKQLDKQQTRLG